MNYDMRKSMKARELKRDIAAIPDDADVCFGPVMGNHIGSLTYYRTKWVDKNLVNIKTVSAAEPAGDRPEAPSSKLQAPGKLQ